MSKRVRNEAPQVLEEGKNVKISGNVFISTRYENSFEIHLDINFLRISNYLLFSMQKLGE